MRITVFIHGASWHLWKGNSFNSVQSFHEICHDNTPFAVGRHLRNYVSCFFCDCFLSQHGWGKITCPYPWTPKTMKHEGFTPSIYGLWLMTPKNEGCRFLCYYRSSFTPVNGQKFRVTGTISWRFHRERSGHVNHMSSHLQLVTLVFNKKLYGWKMHFLFFLGSPKIHGISKPSFVCVFSLSVQKPFDTPTKNVGWPYKIHVSPPSLQNRRHFGGLEKFVQFRITARRFENIWNDPKCWFFQDFHRMNHRGKEAKKTLDEEIIPKYAYIYNYRYVTG